MNRLLHLLPTDWTRKKKDLSPSMILAAGPSTSPFFAFIRAFLKCLPPMVTRVSVVTTSIYALLNAFFFLRFPWKYSTSRMYFGALSKSLRRRKRRYPPLKKHNWRWRFLNETCMLYVLSLAAIWNLWLEILSHAPWVPVGK